MPIERLRPSFNFDEERLAQLRAVAPEAFADGAVNWDTLRQALGGVLEDEDSQAEHFGLFWPGKREARRLASLPSQLTLVPQAGLGVDEDATRNIFIEGDNLDVLKLLQKSYAGRVKLIYIDPPYNTGKDFIYKDDYREPSESYLRRSGQAGERGDLLTSNPKSGGRFHSNWLSMMYPRLVLARQLLREDGVIFISIDDNEVHNLRQLMNEVFGEENFISQIIVLTNPKGRVMGKHFAQCHDYLLVYSCNPLDSDLAIPKTEDEITTQYSEIDHAGRYRLLELRNTHRQFGQFNRPHLFFPLYINPKNQSVSLTEKSGSVKVYPLWDDGFEGCWTWGQKRVQRELEHLVGRQIGDRWKVFRKSYAVGDKGEVAHKKLKTLWLDKIFSTEKGQAAFDDLIPGRMFPSPKPVNLVKTLIEFTTDNDDIILDFFAGSCTTAHALLEFNRQQRSNKRFVCIQLPGALNHTTPGGQKALELGLYTIADIGRERIRRVIARIRQESSGQLDLQPDQDLGFKCYRLAPSNFRAWQDYTGGDVTGLQMRFDQFETPLVEGWRAADLLAEILLMEGFSLDSRITRQAGFAANAVDLVTSDFHAHRLFVCLDGRIAPQTIAQLALGEHDVFVCLDSALDDQTKLSLSDKGKLHAI